MNRPRLTIDMRVPGWTDEARLSKFDALWTVGEGVADEGVAGDSTTAVPVVRPAGRLAIIAELLRLRLTHLVVRWLREMVLSRDKYPSLH